MAIEYALHKPEPLPFMSCYICPVCGEPLEASATRKSYQCPKRHSFDLAREGYLNLLPVQHKHSSEPGDSKAMMQARRAFLEAGFYQPLARAVAAMIAAGKPERVLDLGCGEGYYSRFIEAHCLDVAVHGLDIAKTAVAMAAKKQPGARFIVASSQRLPYADHYFDLLLRVFAPSNDEELKRVLKPDGLLLTVTPGPRHLWQLKEFIYSEVRAHAASGELPPGFECLTTERLHYKITPDGEQRIALLQMTPFAWRAPDPVRQAIKEAPELEIEADFVLTLAKKTAIA
ncbi:23S rRNA (guanine(745)-N(1))-methyltransferase [Methylobacter marinus]|uniref:23S rRNA (guanine(745)-N(1))-methyltransferase n=1 Tax=Methylobacter marinus TaxID=34058 RepID=UPI00039A8607|nr:23S rRNA (guanine(745)-N(1))-methyltransferase [Methylobacter marinus]